MSKLIFPGRSAAVEPFFTSTPGVLSNPSGTEPPGRVSALEATVLPEAKAAAGRGRLAAGPPEPLAWARARACTAELLPLSARWFEPSSLSAWS